MRLYVVGGGPAGISAAIWAHRLGLQPVLVERAATLGGQLRDVTLPIPDLPGWPDLEAQELVQRLKAHLAWLEIPVISGREAVAFDPDAQRLTFADGGVERCTHLIFAPGLRVRRLEVDGEDRVREQSVAEFLRQAEGKRRRCLVVGGGDRALEAASRLAEAGHETVVVHRRDRFRARRQFRERLAASGAMVLWNTSVRAIAHGGDGYTVALQQPGRRLQLAVDEVFVRIGMEPDFKPGIPLHDPEGRVAVVGDAATDTPLRSIVSALAGGMAGARAILRSSDRE